MYLLGYDIGSSSIKASLLRAETGKAITTAFSPKKEMAMIALRPGWAEQPPELWWRHLVRVTRKILSQRTINSQQIKAVGISYQMHGLVLVDKKKKPLRNAIIWCDSRAVEIGQKAFQKIGEKRCLTHLLNSPGNFTASKLKWVKEEEPKIYAKIYKIMLPGDYIAMKLTGKIVTTPSGLSEGIFWDFQKKDVADMVLDYYGIDKDFLPDLLPVFSYQGEVNTQAAKELGLTAGTPVTYRAGDQPNNAFSVNVLSAGEVAATAGTSGVIYGVSSERKYEEKSRLNTFLHVNHQANDPRYGVLLCINGTGSLYSWLKNVVLSLTKEIQYAALDTLAAKAPLGCGNLIILPFGNGVERVLENKDVGCQLINLKFNTHTASHLVRAAQEGIVFSLKYGLDIMRPLGVRVDKIKAGFTNMFLSPLFGKIFATVTGVDLELYNTDGSQGAARAAGYGAGIYKTLTEAFIGLRAVKKIEPDPLTITRYREAYSQWYQTLKKILETN